MQNLTSSQSVTSLSRLPCRALHNQMQDISLPPTGANADHHHKPDILRAQLWLDVSLPLQRGSIRASSSFTRSHYVHGFHVFSVCPYETLSFKDDYFDLPALLSMSHILCQTRKDEVLRQRMWYSS